MELEISDHGERIPLTRDGFNKFFWGIADSERIEVAEVEGSVGNFRKKLIFAGIDVIVTVDANQATVDVGELGKCVVGRYSNNIRTAALKVVERLYAGRGQ